MPDIESDPTSAGPSIVPDDVPAMSDDECLLRLAQAIEARIVGIWMRLRG
jgi:hypothetical protein